MIIEDNPTQLDLYAWLIADEFRVLTATWGEAGYALARAEQPDAIVVDVLLPDVDGLTLCEQLHNDAQTCGFR